LAVTTAPLLFAPTQITVQALAASLALVGLLAIGSHLLRVILLFLLQRSRGAAGFMVICAAWTFVIGFALTSVYMVLAELLAATDPTIPKGTLEGWGAADYAHTFLIMTFLLMVWIGFYLQKGSVPRIIAFFPFRPQCPPKSLRDYRVQLPRNPRHRHRRAASQFSGQKHLVGMPFLEFAKFLQSHAPLFQKLPHNSPRLFLHRLFQRLARVDRRIPLPAIQKGQSRVL
jgi:hypothetical protein